MKTASSVMAIAIASLTISAAAFAQAASPASQEVAQDAVEGIQEIVVTATKRETNLQKTPISISVVGAEMIRDRKVQSLLDLGDGSVPSLRVATFEARQSALTIGIRGIVPLDANQVAREQGVGIYIDGVYLARQHGLNAALFDVERIEVLKGPQGTLFGRNTEGGALSIVSRAPTGEFGGSISAGVGNLGAYNVLAHIDLPAFHNISFKFDGVVSKQGPVTANPLPGQAGWGQYDRQGMRLSMRWKPSDDFTLDIAGDISRDANTPFYNQLLNNNPNVCVAGPAASQPNCVGPGNAPTILTGSPPALSPLVQIVNDRIMRVADIGVVQQESVDRTKGVSARISYKPSDSLELRSITAYRTVFAEQWDNAGGAHRVPAVRPGCTGNACNFSRYSLSDLSQKQFTQELQAVGTLPRVNYVAGLYYFWESVQEAAATPSTMAFNSTLTSVVTLDPCVGAAGFGWQRGCRSIDRNSQATAKSYAVYGQGEYSVTDTIRITLGGRYTHDDKNGLLTVVNNRPVPLSFNQKTNRFTPLAIIAWSPAENVNVYAKYSRGYRTGGAGSRSVTFRTFGPEDVDSYEVGLKSELFDRRVRLNLAGYMMDRKNSQIDFSYTTFDPLLNTTRNSLDTVNAPGISKIRGIEADLTVAPVKGLTMGASYAYTYTDVPLVANPSTGVLQKAYIVFTPRNAASATIDYQVPVGDATLKFNLNAAYSQSTQAFDQIPTRNDASFIVNGRIALQDISLGQGGQKLVISVWSRNLLNEQYVYRRDIQNSVGGNQSTISAPVTINGVTYPVGTVASSINSVIGDYGTFNTPRTFGIDATIRF